jgi:hypothetical protein
LPSRVPEATTAETPPAPYGISDIVAEGCFQPPERLGTDSRLGPGIAISANAWPVLAG